MHQKGKIPILKDGTQWRPFVHVRDTSRAMLSALAADTSKLGSFELLNVGSDEQNYQIFNLAKILFVKRKNPDADDVSCEMFVFIQRGEIIPFHKYLAMAQFPGIADTGNFLKLADGLLAMPPDALDSNFPNRTAFPPDFDLPVLEVFPPEIEVLMNKYLTAVPPVATDLGDREYFQACDAQ